MNECIAQRKLMFSLKGSGERNPFVVQIMAPRELKEGDVEFQFTKGTAVCIVQFEGLPSAKPEKIYGADSLQALQLATNVEPFLKRLSKKYDLFFQQDKAILRSERNCWRVPAHNPALNLAPSGRWTALKRRRLALR